MSKEEVTVFEVDELSDLPIWVQLRNRIAHLIRTGYFSPGEQLPSVRSLAADAKINYNTVTRAYRDLELSGLVMTLRGRGMYVQEMPSNIDAQTETADALVDNCIEQYRTAGFTFEEARNRINSIIDSKIAQQKPLADARREL
ncbi:MAG: GntR family transcriptional regulator [Coriobacteriales bacterium]|nr:GntR family transcriptional regulator [Coriobacteriales bacterium]